MSSFPSRHAELGDAQAVAELISAMEQAHGEGGSYALADLEDEWRTVDLQRDAWVVLDGTRVVGYGSLRDRGEMWRIEAFVHPDAFGRGIGTQLASELEREAFARGAKRVHNTVLEHDDRARAIVRARGFHEVRRFREMRIELTEQPDPPSWPAGFQAEAFDLERDARAFHAAQQEAFADHWEYSPRSFEQWSDNLEGPGFEPLLWCVVREGGEIAAGLIAVAERYGSGWIDTVFTRRPWRRRGLAAALLDETFRKFWDRGQTSIGLGVDAQSDTGAFQLYERAGMHPAWSGIVFEKTL